MSDPRTQTSPIGLLEELDEAGPLVGILVGSESDLEAMDPALAELNERGISHELKVLSAHRDPRGVAEYASTAQLRGVRVIIAGAGMAAALPGVVAAYSDLPVIGVPLRSSKSVGGGLDALLAIAQMPPGVPVACVSVDGSRNAAILAARILAQGGGYPQGPSASIDASDLSLLPPGHGQDLVGRGQARALAGGRARRARRLGRGRRRAGRGRAGNPRRGAERPPPPASRRSRRRRTTTSPRSSTRSRASSARTAAGSTTA